MPAKELVLFKVRCSHLFPWLVTLLRSHTAEVATKGCSSLLGADAWGFCINSMWGFRSARRMTLLGEHMLVVTLHAIDLRVLPLCQPDRPIHVLLVDHGASVQSQAHPWTLLLGSLSGHSRWRT